MIEQLITWALEQTPAIAVLVIGFIVLWRSQQKQQDIICQMLEQCWAHMLKEHDTPDK